MVLWVRQFVEAEALHKEGKFAEAIAALGDEIEDNAKALVRRSRYRAAPASPACAACVCVCVRARAKGGCALRLRMGPCVFPRQRQVSRSSFCRTDGLLK